MKLFRGVLSCCLCQSTSGPKYLVVCTATFCILAVAGARLAVAQDHESRFEMTESFIRNQWRHPVRSLEVIARGAGPVHGAQEDCEIHVGADLVDQSISDFPGIVLEPPNVCKDHSRTRGAWRSFYEGATGKTCSAAGFVRAWPEHLDTSQGESAPRHFMELHPLRELSCPPGPKIVLRNKLKAFADLGYKDAPLVDVIFRTFHLWVKRIPHPDAADLTSVAFDYRVCNREETACSNKITVPNFVRLTARPLARTLRSVAAGASEETFKTVIVRAKPHPDEDSDIGHAILTKVYALEGTDFYQALGDGSSLQKDFDILGIFAIDPLSVIKTLDAMKQKGTEDWTEVSFPIAVIVFGEVVEEN
jgi:hypothetical protein